MPQQVILNYGLASNRRRRRWIVRITLLVAVAIPVIYWHGAIWTQAQIRYEIAALYFAQRHALSINVPGGLPTAAASQVPGAIDPRLHDARSGLMHHWTQLSILRPPTPLPMTYFPSNFAVNPSVLLIAPMQSPDGQRRLVVLNLDNLSLRLQSWTYGSLISPPVMEESISSIWQIDCTTDSHHQNVYQFLTASFDPAKPSQFEMTVIVNDLPRILTGKLRNDFSFDITGNAWIDPRSRLCELAGGAIDLFDAGLGWQPYYTKTPDPIAGFLPDGSFVIADGPQWKIYDQSGINPDTVPAPGQDIVGSLPGVCFSPHGKYFLRGAPVYGWQVLDSLHGTVAAAVPDRQFEPLVFLTEKSLFIAQGNRIQAVDLQTGQQVDQRCELGELRAVSEQRAAFVPPPEMQITPTTLPLRLAVMDWATNQIVARPPIPDRGTAVTLSPDGHLLTEIVNGGMMIFALPSEQPIITPDSVPTMGLRGHVVWSNDSHWLAAAGTRYIYLWPAPKFDKCWRIANPASTGRLTTPVAFSNNDEWLIAQTVGEAKVWAWNLQNLPQMTR